MHLRLLGSFLHDDFQVVPYPALFKLTIIRTKNNLNCLNDKVKCVYSTCVISKNIFHWCKLHRFLVSSKKKKIFKQTDHQGKNTHNIFLSIFQLTENHGKILKIVCHISRIFLEH